MQRLQALQQLGVPAAKPEEKRIEFQIVRILPQKSELRHVQAVTVREATNAALGVALILCGKGIFFRPPFHPPNDPGMQPVRHQRRNQRTIVIKAGCQKHIASARFQHPRDFPERRVAIGNVFHHAPAESQIDGIVRDTVHVAHILDQQFQVRIVDGKVDHFRADQPPCPALQLAEYRGGTAAADFQHGRIGRQPPFDRSFQLAVGVRFRREMTVDQRLNNRRELWHGSSWRSDERPDYARKSLRFGKRFATAKRQ